jgi:homoserine dehydrogenase
VHPTLVHKNDLLAQVSGSFNAVSFYGHALGHALFYGRGAGRMPTASAVVSDVISVAMGVTPLMFRNLHVYMDQTPPAKVLPMEQLKTRFYLRLEVKDQPGVIGAMSQILGQHGISIASIHQHETDSSDAVPVVITTHLAVEGPMRKALEQIAALPTTVRPPVSLRIMDQPKEFAGS